MIKHDDVYRIGRIGKPHGVHGELQFFFDDDVFDQVEAEYLILELNGLLVPFFMEEYRFRGEGSALVKFCDIDTQEQARELTGAGVFFERRLAEEEAEGLSWAMIQGYQVIDASTGAIVGVLRSVDDSTLNTLFEVESQDGKTFLLPAAGDLLAAADTTRRTITLHIPDGLLAL